MELITRIAPMECAAASTMMLLERMGLDPRLFLLDYWNLTYLSQLLVSGKHMRFYALDQLYGVQMELMRGGESDLRELLTAGCYALVPCRASKLPFFPERLLTHEGAGYEHVILVYGCDLETGTFYVQDPIAEYDGPLAYADLQQPNTPQHELAFYMLIPPADDFVPLPLQDMLALVTERNLTAYTHAFHTHSGAQALQMFARDVVESTSWEDERRGRWVEQNNVTLFAIIKMRELLWQSWCELGLLDAEQLAVGEAQVQGIVKLWTMLNFLLLKYKRNPHHPQLPAQIQHKLVELQRVETGFLRQMHVWYQTSQTGGGCFEV